MSMNRLLSVALETVADACRVARTVQRDTEQVRRITKDDKSPVTVADFAVQAIVAMDFAEVLGETLIASEETSGLLRSPEQAAVLDAVVSEVRTHRAETTTDEVLHAIDLCNHDGSADAYWTLDPIDGTKGFLRGQQYAIALARIEHGEVVLGVMGCPNLAADHAAPLDAADADGVIYAATAGGGSWEYLAANPTSSLRRIHTAKYVRSQPIRACESVEASHSKQVDATRILRELGSPGRPARLDSQCKYAVVARGQADVYMRLPTGKPYVEKVWDHAAGMIISQEAGAIVTDITGSPLDFTHGRLLKANRGIVCATAGLHQSIIEVIERLGIGAVV